MSSFPILDLVVGMIFVYFMLSIISSSAIELILTGMQARAKMLEEWLVKMFDKEITQKDGSTQTLAQSILDHCSLSALSKKGKSTSYVDAKNFTSAFLEKITFDDSNPKSVAKNLDDIISSIEKTELLPTEFQRVLLIYANEAKDTYKVKSENAVSEIQLFRGKIENWFDSSMDRVGGTMKTRYTRPATFFVALIVTLSLNADSVALAKYLYSNPEARNNIVMQAYNSTTDSALIKQVGALKIKTDSASKNSPTAQEIKDKISGKIQEIERAKLAVADVMPLTWKGGEFNGADGNFSWLAFISKIAGLLATILAVMMGAPFWFDLLNKISNLRGSGAKPAVSSGGDDKK